MQAPRRRIGALLLAAGVLTGCGGSTSHTIVSKPSATAQQRAVNPKQSCLAHFNTSGQLAPFVTLRRAITGGYVTTAPTPADHQATCAILLFVDLIPHHRAIPVLFMTGSSTGPWQHALPRYDPLSIGNRARIPGGEPVDVARPADLRLAR